MNPPGGWPVTTAEYTSSPAGIEAVLPAFTLVPTPRAATTWSSAPARATPEYSATVPSRYVADDAETVTCNPLADALASVR